MTGDRGKILRVKVTYNDEHGDRQGGVREDRHDGARRTMPGVKTPASKAPWFATANNERTVRNETAKKGVRHVGNPVTATRDEDLTLLTYKLAG